MVAAVSVAWSGQFPPGRVRIEDSDRGSTRMPSWPPPLSSLSFRLAVNDGIGPDRGSLMVLVGVSQAEEDAHFVFKM